MECHRPQSTSLDFPVSLNHPTFIFLVCRCGRWLRVTLILSALSHLFFLITGIVVSEYCEAPSHWNSNRTISQWLRANNIPAIYDVDTRALIKIIREKGSLAGKIVLGEDEDKVPFVDIGKRNLVAEVSTKEIVTYTPKNPKKKVIVVDCGAKINQLRYALPFTISFLTPPSYSLRSSLYAKFLYNHRCLLKRGIELRVVPWDYDFTKETDWDGLFVSNGPGDPSWCETTIDNIRKAMALEPPKYVHHPDTSYDFFLPSHRPMFGVCMGNQLMGLAAGAKTFKMGYGNRGLNQPCVDLRTGRCHITSQNHGYVLDNDTVTITG